MTLCVILPKPEAADFAPGARDLGRDRVQAAGHGARDQGNPRCDSSGVMPHYWMKIDHHPGRKAVIGRPILYKSTKEFLLRFDSRCGRTAQHGGVRKAGGRVVPNDSAALSDNGADGASADAGEAKIESGSEAIEAGRSWFRRAIAPAEMIRCLDPGWPLHPAI
jgi:hypothetical protein